ncbi:MAG: glycosyltransferase [Candidatus Lokiarchaeota archaeon]|nr:glycosyltransferase [Candidatus Lokiarchaeota archaeon]MBD3201907.1 glycosyltransferase [Candidatus Lokiarchaeota archaeon]
MLVSIIIITLNEIDYIRETIQRARLAAQSSSGKNYPIEIIVSDGGSTDGTQQIVKDIADKVIYGPKGRYLQLNSAVKYAKGDILLFLHADTYLPDGAIIRILSRIKDPNILGGGFKKFWNWDPSMKRSPFLKFASQIWQVIGNWLVRLFKIFPGDNAIFTRRTVFEKLNGFKSFAICEDLDFSNRLKNLGKDRVALIQSSVITSTRRYKKYGFFYTNFVWFLIFWLWRFGLSPERLEKQYRKYMPLKFKIE